MQVLLSRTGGAACAGPATRPVSATATAAIRREQLDTPLREQLDTNEQPVTEIGLELRVEDLLRRALHVVVDPLELEHARLGVVDRVAGARIIVARLADRS